MRQYSSQGYTFEQIRAFLLKNNLPQRDVDEAISFVKSNTNGIQSSNPLESQLRNYFQTQSHNGYNISQISNSLISQGYPITIVNKISSEFNTVNLKHEVHFSKSTIIGILLVIIVATGSYFAISHLFNKTTNSLLDVTISTDEYSFNAGDVINFQIYITNMGSPERFDVSLKYVILDESNKQVASKEDTVALQTTASLNRNIIIPSGTPAGRYRLQVTAKYGSSSAKGSTEFEVVSNTVLKNTTSKPVTIKNSTINNPNTLETYVPPVTMDTGKTFGELLTDVKATSVNDPESALPECSDLASLDQKDICFSVIADSSGSYEYCSRVDSTTYRDNCYMSFVLKGNVDVCQYITDADNSAFCNQLRIVQLMNKYYQENNTEKVLELRREFNPGIYNSEITVPNYEYTYTEPVTIMTIANSGPVNEAPEEATPPADNTTAQDNSSGV